MLVHIDNLLEKDGLLAKLAGVLSAALFSAIAGGLIPPEHVEGAAVLAGNLALFAPAAMRRGALAKRASAEGEE